MNPAEWLQRAATRDPDAPALFRGAHQVANYGEFLRSAAGIGAALGAQGIGPGSRVAVFMANRTEYLEALYGIWFCGAAAVPINAKLHEKEAVWIIENAEAVLVLTDDKLGHAWEQSSISSKPTILKPGPTARPICAQPASMPSATRSLKQIAASTSG